jgi:inhibitor of cysteine peptidase
MTATLAAPRNFRTDMAEVVIDSSGTGSSVVAAPGDIVVVRLDEMPTSGYRWAVDSFDSGVMEAAGDDFTPAADSALGGGGTREFRFRVVGPGEGGLKLTRRRAWETDSPDAESFEATICAEG